MSGDGISFGSGGSMATTSSYASQQPMGIGMSNYHQGLMVRLPASSIGTAASSGGGGTFGIQGNNGEGSSTSDGSRGCPPGSHPSPEYEMHFARIIGLYYMVMEHAPLYACLRLLYSQQNPNNANKSALYNVIRDLCTKPRTLKQMARVIIYNAVGQRPALTMNKLPLPPALREYVLNFEP